MDFVKWCEFWHCSQNIGIVQQQNHLLRGHESPDALMVGLGHDLQHRHLRGLLQVNWYHLLARTQLVLDWQQEGYMGWPH